MKRRSAPYIIPENRDDGYCGFTYEFLLEDLPPRQNSGPSSSSNAPTCLVQSRLPTSRGRGGRVLVMPIHAVDAGMSGNHVHSVVSRRRGVRCDQHVLPVINSRTDIYAVVDRAPLCLNAVGR